MKFKNQSKKKRIKEKKKFIYQKGPTQVNPFIN